MAVIDSNIVFFALWSKIGTVEYQFTVLLFLEEVEYIEYRFTAVPCLLWMFQVATSPEKIRAKAAPLPRPEAESTRVHV